MSSQSLDAVESAGGEDMPAVAATMVAAVLEKASIPPSKGPENAGLEQLHSVALKLKP